MGAFGIWHFLILFIVLLTGFGVGVWARNAREGILARRPRASYGGARKLGIDRARPQRRRRPEKPWARGRWRTTVLTLTVWAALVTGHVWEFSDANEALRDWLILFLGGGALLAWVIWGWVYQDPRKPLLHVPQGAYYAHSSGDDDEDGPAGPWGIGIYVGGVRVDDDDDRWDRWHDR